MYRDSTVDLPRPDAAFSILVTTQEPVLPLYLEATYGLDTSKIGLVYIAAVVPSFICKLLYNTVIVIARPNRDALPSRSAQWVVRRSRRNDHQHACLYDRHSALLDPRLPQGPPRLLHRNVRLPEWVSLRTTRHAHRLTHECFFTDFFSSAPISPITAELAAIARNMEGVGCE